MPKLTERGRPSLLGVALLLAVFASACSDASARVAAAERLLGEGNFDQAFEAYERLYQNGERAPEVLGGLGLLLSAQPVAAFAGVDLMEQSLAKAPTENETVREQLMLLYLAMDQLPAARALIHPDRLSVEQVYSPGITRMRLGLNCLRSPGQRSLKRLADAPAHPRRDFFLILCGVRQPGDRSQPEAAIQQWREFRQSEARTACEALGVWPEPEQIPALRRQTPANARRRSGMAAFLRVERARCQSDFPGEISIQRDAQGLRQMAAASSAESAGKVAAERELFDIDAYEPGDPGAEIEKRTYRPPPAPSASDGPFVPLSEIP